MEAEITDSGSPFGLALREPLAAAGPIREGAPFDLVAWLRALDLECSEPPPAPTTTAPQSSSTSGAAGTLQPDYVAAFVAAFGTVDVPTVISAFSDGSLAALAPDAATGDEWDAWIRRNPPVWTASASADADGAGDAVDPVAAFAQVCAELYVVLRSGFNVLPPGTTVETATATPNYRSVDDNVEDVRTEVARLRELGHLITWETAQERHPSLRSKSHPDHVLALGVVVKRRPDNSKKTRLVIDPSRAVTREAPHTEVAGINDGLPLPPCRLPTVLQASRALHPHCWFFLADIVDAYLCTKHAVDSLRHVGVLFDDILMTYDSLCFGLKTAPAHQQRLATVFSRIVLRRWAEAGLSIGAVPGHELFQPYPTPGDKRCYLFAYLDDFCGIGFATKAEAETAYGIFCDAADELGLPLQYAAKKVVPPTQRTEFLGVVFCARSMTLSLSPERIAKMAASLDALVVADTISVADLQKVIGVFMFGTVVFALCRPYLRRMLDLLKSAGPNPAKQRRLRITAEARDDIVMWRRILGVLRLNSRPVSSLSLRRRTVEAECYSDASFYGGAYFWGGIYRFWRWGPDIRARIGGSSDDGVFICELEALALLQAVRDLAPLMLGPRGKGGRRLVCHIDNDPLVSMLAKHSSRSAACTPVLRELTGLLLAFGLELAPVWIASADNEVADQLSRANELSAAELLGTVRRWSAAHPNVTAWSRGAPVRPEMLETFDRHPWQPAGSPHFGVQRARAALAPDICPACGADPCECGGSQHRVWVRRPS